MEWIIVIGLIVLGTSFIVGEVLFIPGVFIAGSIGAGLNIWGCAQSFEYFGTDIGFIVSALTIIVNAFALWFTFRGKTWERFALKESNQSKFNENHFTGLTVGQSGKTISSLKPVGKALINEKVYQVRSKGNFIAENTTIKILKIESSNITVETLQ